MKALLLVLLITVVSFSKELNVTVSILPQKYFVEQIAGDKVNVNVMVRPGFSPATYEPQTSQMKLLGKSTLYLSIGVPFENSWLDKFKDSNSNMKIIDTSKGIQKLPMLEHHHEEEGHHDEHDEHEAKHHDEHKEHKAEHHDEHEEHHIHEDGLDPHIWLNPVLVKIQAKNIYDALSTVDKENSSFYLNNLNKFLKRLDDLNNEIKHILKDVKSKEFMVFHPSWGYFAQEYGLEQLVVEKEGKEPKPKELVELIKEAKLHNITTVFVSKQFSQKAAKTIAQSIDGKVFEINPLAYDYAKNLIYVANSIANHK